jgi:cyclic beta-1,2-glucan synthetase
LEEHAQDLALEHLHGTGVRRGRPLAPRVRENARRLERFRRELGLAVSQGRAVPPAAKWLLDNQHLVSDLGKAILAELPSAYYRELPKLGPGDLDGYPRVYGLAWNWMAHCDSHFDPETLRRYVAAYQRTQPLMIGELWALPINLRIVLLENLRRQAQTAVLSLRATGQADRLADRLLGLVPGPTLEPRLVPLRFKGRALPAAFSSRLFQRLRDQGAAVAPVQAWLDEGFRLQKATAEGVVRQERQDELTRNATCKNAITSLRDIAFLDWPPFVESVCLVDGVLQGAFDFQGLSFATRDRYRHAVEGLARGSGYTQLEVARFAIKQVLAARAAGRAVDSPQADAGDPLIGPASRAFERQLKYRVPWGSRVRRAATSLGAPLYLGSLTALTLGALCLPLGPTLLAGVGAPWALALAVLALWPASEMAVALANHAVTRLWPPRTLAALALKGGIPARMRTMVVMPVILDAVGGPGGGFGALAEAMEVHYLANADGEVFFGLLTDWPDADAQEQPGEPAALRAGEEAVAALNRRHGAGPGGAPRFTLFHRRRRFNPAEGCWMGWERKRGKLLEFNRLLRGRPGTSFATADGLAPTPPAGVRFVITLDQDTRLPRGAALKLVGTLAHPLNLPRLNAAGDRVAHGYGILQPRISPTLPPDGEGTVFNRLSSGRAGADPYALAVSEVYQDLFDEGSYTGKGIYDVDAFDACLAGRVPDNRLLSHDLLEGSFARAGLVTEVEFFEEFSGHYQAALGCKHRWTRGDWQLLPWIVGFAPGGRARFGAVARWKMVDNLRRSLVAPACLAALVAAFFLRAPLAWAWAGFVGAGLALPQLLGVLVAELLPRRRDQSLLRHWRSLAREGALGMLKAFVAAALLPAEAWSMVDAVARSLYRQFISRQGLLEWTTASRGRRGLARGWGQFFALMKAGPLTGVAVLAALAWDRAPAWPLGAAFALLWLASPALGRTFSLPRAVKPAGGLDAGQTESLELSARRTWSFFEAFVGPEVHHLPPDNFQEDPRPTLAPRTSPTNLGLYLLSAVAAQDFGWLTPTQLLERFERALDSMEAMEKHQGHFYNWYDLGTLQPLEPRFVSTVDSGNLAGHLLVARQALLELGSAPLVGREPLKGLRASLALARAAALAEGSGPLGGMHQRDLAAVLDELGLAIAAPCQDAPTLLAGLGRLKALTGTLVDIAESLALLRASSAPGGAEGASQLLRWSQALAAEGEAVAAQARTLLAGAPAGFDPRLAAAPATARRAQAVADRLQALFDAMRFGFLYDPGKKLLSIGYRAVDGRLDPGCYDLLASEARLASYLAVARGDADPEHWSRLGRSFAAVGSSAALLSWSGSMFEYLMPLLVMPSPRGSLLAETYHAVVRRQIRSGKARGLPWGVSESACNVRDKDMTYQYSDFGVEGLGLKPGLGKPKVVAPYATALALMVAPVAAAENLARLEGLGALGPYGYYDALDFGEARFPEGQGWAVVRTYMAHHQGMVLVSILNALQGRRMQARFQAVPLLRSAGMLLQERMPQDVAFSRLAPPALGPWLRSEPDPPVLQRRFDSPHLALPATHLLGNGSYSVMLSAAGGGWSRWKGSDITRFRPDPTCDAWGSFILIRDEEGGECWSAAYLPSRREPDSYRVLFREDKAEYIRRDGPVETRLEVAVSPEDDVEVRRLTLRNHGSRRLELELTSYAEVSLAPAGADEAHPAFAKLFVQTEYVAALGALLAHRSPRGPKEPAVWSAHLSFADKGGGGGDGVHFETDRARFLGRGRDILDPAMGVAGSLFSSTVGAVLDPIFSLRRRVSLEPGAVARITFATMAAPSREAVLALADKARDPANLERLFDQAWVHAQAQMRHRGIQPEEARLYQALAGHLIYPDPRLRPPGAFLAANRLGPPVLWAHGLSGTRPILLLRLDEASDREILRQLLLAWDYWRLKDLDVDLVILNEEPASYADPLQRALEEEARLRQGAPLPGRGGVIRVVKACLLPAAERDLLLCAASATLQAGHGSLFEQMARVQPQHGPAPKPSAPISLWDEGGGMAPRSSEALEFMNGLGGFAADGHEYVVTLEDDQSTPAPWVNVIANPGFGFLASESGSGYTWAGNARENKLTPWSNDPVSDPPGEAFYVRDEDSGALMSPTALPIRLHGGRYTARHGQGYTRFGAALLGLELTLTQFVPLADPVKVSRLVVKNASDRPRRLSLTAYAQWVLGSSAQGGSLALVTESAADLGVLTARNPFNPACPQALAFLDVGGLHRAFTGDRREFLGPHGSLREPLALGPGRRLSGRVGAGMDPCGALQSFIELEPGESAELRVLLGQASDREDLARLVSAYRAADLDQVLDGVRGFWQATVGALQVRTPDRALDLMLNRWLTYQALSCRVWARTAFYQCGGAYGFRDQLQDVLALTLSRPEIVRAHLLRAAAEQFVEGDALHWWHPPTGAGVRTRITDDRLWLPYAVARYAQASGDAAVLDEPAPFLQGPALAPGAEDLYFQPAQAEGMATLYEHCARALDVSLGVGAHGLPLMGGGDWNDGMNRVGIEGRGESVWLAWFLIENLRRFAPIALARGDISRAALWRGRATALAAAAEAQGWDGDWYRRAYFDDGSPLGSSGLAECRIDAIAQSWAVLSGAADPARAARAMAALEEYLWKKNDRLQVLLAPPFTGGAHDPGYIRGYPPGIRENGGQYNHAAAWSVAAFAALGQGAKAHELFATVNPVGLTGTRAGMLRYKLEPYVMAGDVYSQAPHVGRGGWSWYTGSAAWMQRAGVESILGLTMLGDAIRLDPCIPPTWPGFSMSLLLHGTRWEIEVLNPQGVSRGVAGLTLDGAALPPAAAARIALKADGAAHRLQLRLGAE